MKICRIIPLSSYQFIGRYELSKATVQLGCQEYLMVDELHQLFRRLRLANRE